MLAVRGPVKFLRHWQFQMALKALKTGVSMFPHSPESNSLYLARSNLSRRCTPCVPPAQSSNILVLA